MKDGRVSTARSTPRTITVGSRLIGDGQPCFIIAEAGVNHNGRLEMAYKLVDAAVRSGADAVKFQTFKAHKVISACAPKALYQMQTTGEGESQLEMAKRLELPFEAFRQLDHYCRQQGILFMSTPFDDESAEFLAQLGVPVFKIPSGEITNLPFLARVARYGRPMIVSTGMSTLQEVETAVRIIRDTGNRQLVLLHCVSNYPADPAETNLLAMRTMVEAFEIPVGYSDHTPGIDVALAAVAVGACVIEKHFTLDRHLPGPDHRASLEPDELTALVRGIRTVTVALGHGRKEPATSEASTAAVARKSVVAARDIPGGTILTEELLAIKRPGTGLSPAMRSQIVGRRARRDIPEDMLISEEMLG